MGGLASKNKGVLPTLIQMIPPKPTFSVDQIPDLTGRVAIVTGGNVGIGYETIKALLQHNAKVYLAARSKEKADAAIASLNKTTGKDAIFLQLDLADLAATKKAAEEFLSKEHELHMLFNNAGLATPPIDWVTKDGFDMQWGTNVVGHFLFTKLLMPALLAGVATSPDHHVRIVTTSSSGAYMSEGLHWDTFKDGPARRKLSPGELYFQSKLGDAMLARQLAKRYADKGVVSITLNPGNIESDLQRHFNKVARWILYRTILYPTATGALTQLFAGTMPEAINYNGEFLIPFARLGKCRPEMYDDALGEKLWQMLEDSVKEFV